MCSRKYFLCTWVGKTPRASPHMHHEVNEMQTFSGYYLAEEKYRNLKGKFHIECLSICLFYSIFSSFCMSYNQFSFCVFYKDFSLLQIQILIFLSFPLKLQNCLFTRKYKKNDENPWNRAIFLQIFFRCCGKSFDLISIIFLSFFGSLNLKITNIKKKCVCLL